MRILQIAPSIDPQKGGREKHVFKLVKELAYLGHEVTVITSDPDLVPHNEPFESHTLSTINIPGLPAIPLLGNLLELMKRRFTLCHIHYHALFGEIALIASRIRKIPAVVTFHTEMKRGFHKSIYDRVALVFTFSLSEKIICLSNSLKEGLIRKGLDSEKIVVIPNFIDLSAIKPSIDVNDPSYQSDILFVGRLEKRKGIEELLQILLHLSKKGVRYSAYIVGKGPLEELVKSKISSYFLKNNVRYLGYVEESVLRKLYNETKIVVVPSSYEGFPTVCLEAMFYGKVVIGFNIPGLRDILVDVDPFLVAKAFDIEDLTNKIIHFLNDSDHRLHIGEKSKEKVKKYDVALVLETICNIYRKVSTPRKSKSQPDLQKFR
jgi:glycosyltransferase involved in cell wall biosynthesis